MEPLRVYVGLNSAETVGGTGPACAGRTDPDRRVRPHETCHRHTDGTGWVDPESQIALEYLLRGDVASVSVQYSYLASWLALMADPEYGIETARAVFARSTTTGGQPSARRAAEALSPRPEPRFVQLGPQPRSLSGDRRSLSGRLLGRARPSPAGPGHRDAPAQRGTPFWLPEFRDGSVIRFTSQTNTLDDAPAPWGPYRIIYLQYASDAVTFFDPNALWRRPAWFRPRRPGCQPGFRLDSGRHLPATWHRHHDWLCRPRSAMATSTCSITTSTAGPR